MACIYGLFDPSKQRRLIRYVGYTAGPPEARLFEHIAWALKRSHDGSTRRFSLWLRKFVKKGKLPSVVILESLTTNNWEERERHWIEQHAGPTLLNTTIGGRGVTARTERQLTLQMQHAKQQSRDNIGRIWVNDGVCNLWVKPADVPAGFKRGRLFNTGIGKRNRGSIWVTDGKNNLKLAPGQSIPLTFRKGKVVWRGYNPKLAKKHGDKWRNSRWITDGQEVKRLPAGEPVPQGWVVGRRHIRWITDGTKSRQLPASDPLPTGWVYGRVVKQKENHT
jgi:hypothetical protein